MTTKTVAPPLGQFRRKSLFHNDLRDVCPVSTSCLLDTRCEVRVRLGRARSHPSRGRRRSNVQGSRFKSPDRTVRLRFPCFLVVYLFCRILPNKTRTVKIARPVARVACPPLCGMWFQSISTPRSPGRHRDGARRQVPRLPTCYTSDAAHPSPQCNLRRTGHRRHVSARSGGMPTALRGHVI